MNRWTLVGALIFMNGTATACSSCSLAMISQPIPAIVPWSYIFLGWYLILVILGSVFHTKIPGIPKFPKAVIFVAVAGFLALASLGPVVFLPFGLFAFLGWISIVFTNRTHSLQQKHLWLAHSVGIVAITATVVTGVLENAAAKILTAADLVAKWEGTPVARATMARLRSTPPNLPELRKLMQIGDGYSVAEAAATLAKQPSAKSDVALILATLERVRKIDNVWFDNDIEVALSKASGFDMPSDTPIDVWRQKLQEAGLQQSP